MSKEKKYTIQQARNRNSKITMARIRTFQGKRVKKGLAALKLIKEEEIKLPTSFTCLYCRKNKVKLLESPTFAEFIENSTMCSGGTIQSIHIGWGSIFDTEKLVVTLCDPCIEKLTDKKHILTLP